MRIGEIRVNIAESKKIKQHAVRRLVSFGSFFWELIKTLKRLKMAKGNRTNA